MKISRLNFELKDDRIIASCNVQRKQTQRLWLSIPAVYEHFINKQVYDSFIAAVLYDCMHSGEDLEVEGAANSTLLQNLMYYNASMRSFFPHLKLIKINAMKIIDQSCSQGQSTGLGFSCGVDSMLSLYERGYLNNDKYTKITHLINHNVGSHGKADNGKKLWVERLELIRTVADKMSLPLITIDSNLDEICETDFESSYASRNIAGALLLSKGINKYYVASNNAYEDLCPESSNSLSDHLLSNGVCRVIHDGAQYKRIEKIRIISDWKIACQFLNVCTSSAGHGKNCSKCTKCIRFMVSADALGLRRNFEDVFDFSNLEEQKLDFVRKMNRLGTTSPNFYWKELVDYLNKQTLPANRVQRKIRVSNTWRNVLKKPMNRAAAPLPARLSAERAYFFSDKKGLNVLEIGCNSHEIKEYFAKIGIKHKGFDLDSKLADDNGDMCELPYENSSFDAILINSTLQYADNPFQAVKEFSRVLRKEGAITGTVPFMEPGNWGSKFHFTARGLFTLFSACGFKVKYIWPSTSVFEALKDARTDLQETDNADHTIEIAEMLFFKAIEDPDYNLAGSLNFHAIKTEK